MKKPKKNARYTGVHLQGVASRQNASGAQHRYHQRQALPFEQREF